MCSSTNITGTGKNFSFELKAAECVPKGVKPINSTKKCYKDTGRTKLKEVDPETDKKLAKFETTYPDIKAKVEVCVCKGELCNSSVKSAVSGSVIISSAVISFMLFA
ncbi:hypothetical protein HOLleu_11942 [Holothuria leucospilota]|uniref:Protein sleepless n=1 Tax=Holothuria leucospilota TaxID=206669 RepID=A0A9Q1CAN7_HOLLE|nr:hypothetical protein HOLleu_11942 [Holothuria leucospilota]